MFFAHPTEAYDERAARVNRKYLYFPMDGWMAGRTTALTHMTRRADENAGRPPLTQAHAISNQPAQSRVLVREIFAENCNYLSIINKNLSLAALCSHFPSASFEGRFTVHSASGRAI